jgi:hypothetical protein
MEGFMSFFAASRFLALVSVSAFALSPAFAGSTLTLPETDTGAVAGPAFKITNTANGTSSTHPIAVEGIVSGHKAHAVNGVSNGVDGIGIYGQASRSGSYAVFGVNTSTDGNAANFQATNANNASPAVSITTNGSNSSALYVTNTGMSKGTETDAGFFELNGPNAVYPAFAVHGVSMGGSTTTDGGYGNAADFEIINAHNTSDAVFMQTLGSGNALDVAANGSSGTAIQASDNTGATTGIAIYAHSVLGKAGYFVGGSGGTQSCAYDGSSAGWSCNAQLAMMEDRTAPDFAELLQKLDAMPVDYFRTKGAKVPARSLGPSAEDFHAAFGLGSDDHSIAEGNAHGVALAAAKGLYRELKADEATISAQEAKIASLEARLAAQDAAMASVQATLAHLTSGVLREARAESNRD